MFEKDMVHGRLVYLKDVEILPLSDKKVQELLYKLEDSLRTTV
jgi:hypothetical protein